MLALKLDVISMGETSRRLQRPRKRLVVSMENCCSSSVSRISEYYADFWRLSLKLVFFRDD